MNRFLSAIILSCLLAAPAFAADMENADTGPAPASRTDGLAHAPDAAPAAVDIKAVMDGPDFSHRETVQELKFRHDWFKDWKSEPEKKKTASAGPWLKRLGDFFVWIFSHALVILALIVLVLAYRYRQRWLGLLRRSPANAAIEPFVARIDEAPEDSLPLPDDIVQAAEQAWQTGSRRQALSLLYRGAAASLGLPPAATESENLALVRRHQTVEVNEAFSELVRAWQALAWAHQEPSDLTPLSNTYRRHFRRGVKA